MKSPTVLLISLLTDVKRLIPGVEGIDRDIITINSRVEHEGIGFLTNALPSLCDALDRGLASGRFTCPLGFRKLKGGALPRLFSGLLCEVFDSFSGELVSDPPLDIVKCLREVLRLYKKLTLPSKREETLDKEAKVKFEECDKLCPDEILLDETENYIFDRVCRYILPNIESFDERELYLKHGPGAVAEGVRPNQKWQALLSCDPLLESYGLDNIMYDASNSIDSNANTDSASRDTARLVTVPKNSTSRRTITIEPLARQFVQQGFNTLLRDNINKCGILSQCLQLTDQGLNQKLALEGSITGYWSTLDLSSASDLLSLRLVEKVFKDKPILLNGLLECRSPKVEIGNRQFELRKYAGMGNATTFPVQSVVFAVLAITALLDGFKPSYRNVQRVSRMIRVYGDDIIVPTSHYARVVSLIEKVGLKVNLHKSFFEGNFRESCGVDAYRGVEVTPLYVRHDIRDASKSEASIYAHFVSLCNHAWLRGLYTLSETIRSVLEEGRKLPLVSSTSGLLGLHTRQEATEFHRWNSSLHRFETFGLMLHTPERKDVIDGYAALLKFFVTSNCSEVRGWKRILDPSPALSFSKSPVRFKSRISKRWVAP